MHGAEFRRTPEAGSTSSQFFARGFELDFGTDFDVELGGIPLNTPSHVHGPGNLDQDRVIPELVEGFQYAKGPYLASQSAVAGSAALELGTVRDPFFSFTYGGAVTDRYARFLWAESLPTVTYALDLTRSERPWNDLTGSARLNATFRKDGEGPMGRWNITALLSDDRTDSGGATPARPWPPDGKPNDVRAGDGKWNLSALLGWRLVTPHARFRVYGGAHRQRTWNNWTFFLKDPVNGDQTEQLDRRAFLGADADRTWVVRAGDAEWTHVLGAAARTDRVTAEVAPTVDRDRIGTGQGAQGGLHHGTLHGQSTARWTSGWEAFFGLRLDAQVNRLLATAGDWRPQDRAQVLGSPRAGLSYSPAEGTVFSARAGRGFRVGDAFRDTRPMTRTTSVELSAQTRPARPWVTSLTLWRLDLESEVLFDPLLNAFTARGPARHEGLEFYNELREGPWHFELALGWNRAAFKEPAHGLDRVPGSVPCTGYLGAQWQDRGLTLGARLRHTGGRPLELDGAHFADRQDALELKAELELHRWTFAVEVLNAFNMKKYNHEYYYSSRFPGQAAMDDRHLKTADPQAIRVELRRRF